MAPRASPPRTSPPQRPNTPFRVPLWLCWVLSLSVAAALVLALVLFVESHSSDAPAPESAAAAAEQNQETQILVSQDQAPHSARLKAGAAPTAALEHAINADMNFLIVHQELDGPLQSSKCTRAASHSARRVAFSCTAVADNVNYPFAGVVDIRSRQLTFCKRDPAPLPSENVPISPRCLA